MRGTSWFLPSWFRTDRSLLTGRQIEREVSCPPWGRRATEFRCSALLAGFSCETVIAISAKGAPVDAAMPANTDECEPPAPWGPWGGTTRIPLEVRIQQAIVSCHGTLRELGVGGVVNASNRFLAGNVQKLPPQGLTCPR